MKKRRQIGLIIIRKDNKMKKVYLIIFVIFLLTNIVMAVDNNRIKYSAFQQIGNDYTYGSILPGYPLSEDNEMMLEECKKFIKDEAKNDFYSSLEQYVKYKKDGNEKLAENYKPNYDNLIKGEGNNGGMYFCWPSDATPEEQTFLRNNYYISPKTKDKIFPLGERKYTNEPKVKMELAEEDKK